MSDRASPPARAVVTPASSQPVSASQPISATLHSTTMHESTQRSSRRDGAEPAAKPISGEVPATTLDVQTTPRTCPSCKVPALHGMKFCRECGTALPPLSLAAADLTQTEPQPVPAPASCWRCHGKRDAGAAFCRFCGASFVEASAAAPRVTPIQNQPVQLPQVQPGSARLVTLLKDGSEGRSIPLAEADADIGASEGSVTFPDDPYMSPRHARVSFRSGSYTLRDLDSVNGVYVRLREETELRDRDMVLIGQQVLRFELLGDGELSLGPAWQRGVLVFGTPEAARFARLVQYTTEGVARDVHYLFRDETAIGRENGDIVFTDDPFLSRRHAAVRVDHARRRYTLHDLGSSNGTALRIRGEHVLRDGDQFRVGRHLFRYEAGPVGGRAGR